MNGERKSDSNQRSYFLRTGATVAFRCLTTAEEINDSIYDTHHGNDLIDNDLAALMLIISYLFSKSSYKI
jgi:hypothetical protein